MVPNTFWNQTKLNQNQFGSMVPKPLWFQSPTSSIDYTSKCNPDASVYPTILKTKFPDQYMGSEQNIF